MSKTKLLILLLISICISACINKKLEKNRLDFQVGYISGGYDGLQLSKQLKSNLQHFGIFNSNSTNIIEANIKHKASVFITNIDNTSEREKIVSGLSVKIYNQGQECYVYNYTNEVSQFYIYSPADKFISNKSAVTKIKKTNLDRLVKNFINQLIYAELNCEQ